MRRRHFLGVVGGVAAWPLKARAQQSVKVWRIGFISGGARPVSLKSSPVDAFLQGMSELGYVEGRDFVMEWRFAETRFELFPDLAAELVRLKADVIVVATGAAVRPLRQVTTSIPIVMGGGNIDAVRAGFASSLARPGGNVTGLSGGEPDTISKLLDLLVTAIPNLSRVALLENAKARYRSYVWNDLEISAQKLGVNLLRTAVAKVEDIEGAFSAMKTEHVQAVIVAGEPLLMTNRRQIAQAALKNKLPSICTYREYAEVGGLMSYGASFRDFFRRAAYFVDKIFKGASPADLPMEQPTRFYLVINLKTAKAMGLEIPPKLVVLADEVID